MLYESTWDQAHGAGSHSLAAVLPPAYDRTYEADTNHDYEVGANHVYEVDATLLLARKA